MNQRVSQCVDPRSCPTNSKTIMPGYLSMQAAQPSSHHGTGHAGLWLHSQDWRLARFRSTKRCYGGCTQKKNWKLNTANRRLWYGWRRHSTMHQVICGDFSCIKNYAQCAERIDAWVYKEPLISSRSWGATLHEASQYTANESNMHRTSMPAHRCVR